jgi:hypothetical protein
MASQTLALSSGCEELIRLLAMHVKEVAFCWRLSQIEKAYSSTLSDLAVRHGTI